MSKELLHVTDESFQTEVLEADKPVLLDFWAPWCAPCHMLTPTIEQLATEYDGRVLVGKMNTDENGESPLKYGIMGIPTLIIFKDGEEVERLVGVRPKAAIVDRLNAVLAKGE